jgi:hypothetical protein
VKRRWWLILVLALAVGGCAPTDAGDDDAQPTVTESQREGDAPDSAPDEIDYGY